MKFQKEDFDRTSNNVHEEMVKAKQWKIHQNLLPNKVSFIFRLSFMASPRVPFFVNTPMIILLKKKRKKKENGFYKKTKREGRMEQAS
jgi:hypothetical protein